MKLCSFCDSKAVAKGLCPKHRMRIKRHGNIVLPPRTVNVKLRNVTAERSKVKEVVAEMERILSVKE